MPGGRSAEAAVRGGIQMEQASESLPHEVNRRRLACVLQPD